MSQAEDPHPQRWLADLEVEIKINMRHINEKPILPLMEAVSEDGLRPVGLIFEYSLA